MSYLGGSGSSASDPYIIDELEDLPPLINNVNNGINYIAFPEVYDGPKVLDMRSKGWIRSSFLNISVNSGSVNKNVYFNGWTILGMSFMNCNFLRFYRQGSGSASNFVVRFYDLIIKNMYILGAESDSFLFRLEASWGVRVECYRCKFSVTLDSQYARTGLFLNVVDEEEFIVNRCSINVSFINTNRDSSRIITIIDDYRRGRFSFINNVVSLNSRRWYAPYDGYSWEYQNIFRCASMRFNKIIGNIKMQLIGNDNTVSLIRGVGTSVYNVVDINIDCTTITSNFTIYNTFESGVNLFNTEHIATADGITASYSASNCVQCNDSQMTDTSWLTDHSFLVGTPPST